MAPGNTITNQSVLVSVNVECNNVDTDVPESVTAACPACGAKGVGDL